MDRQTGGRLGGAGLANRENNSHRIQNRTTEKIGEKLIMQTLADKQTIYILEVRMSQNEVRELHSSLSKKMFNTKELGEAPILLNFHQILCDFINTNHNF